MATGEPAGIVQELWRFPVKSMRGENLEKADITSFGMLGDRAFALIDVETGKVISAKNVRHFPGMLECTASFVEPPRPGQEMPPVRITLPDRRTATSDSAAMNPTLSAYFQREVRLTRAAPETFSADPQPAVTRRTEPHSGAWYLDGLGVPCPPHVGTYLDLYPVSVLTTSTLARLAELAPESRFDLRRFRMNVIVETSTTGFVENEWVGREVALGDAVRLQVALLDPRCAMTTLPQAELPADSAVLRSLVLHNNMPLGTGGPLPCAGVYATVGPVGGVRVGDRVTVA